HPGDRALTVSGGCRALFEVPDDIPPSRPAHDRSADPDPVPMRPPSLPGSVVVSSSRPERAGRPPVLDGLVGGSILYRLVPWIAGHPALLNRDAMHGGDGQGGMLPTAVVICPTQVGGPDLPMGGHMAHVRTRGGPATPCPSYGPEGAWAGTPHRPVPLRHGFPRRARSRQPRKRT